MGQTYILKETATILNASATSGSVLNAYKLKSKEVIARATSGANMKVFAAEKITVSATSGANISYKGAPKQVDSSSNSGGNINAKE